MYYLIKFNKITYEINKKKITREKYINKLFILQKTFIDSPEFVINRIITERLYNLIFSKKRELCIDTNIVSRKLWETSLLIQNLKSDLSEKVIIHTNLFLIKSNNKELIKLIMSFLKNNLINDKLNYNNLVYYNNFKILSLKLLCIRIINVNKLNKLKNLNELNNSENLKNNKNYILPKNMLNYY